MPQLELQDILAQEIASFKEWLYSIYLETFFMALRKVICRFPSPFSTRGSVEGLVQNDPLPLQNPGLVQND